MARSQLPASASSLTRWRGSRAGPRGSSDNARQAERRLGRAARDLAVLGPEGSAPSATSFPMPPRSGIGSGAGMPSRHAASASTAALSAGSSSARLSTRTPAGGTPRIAASTAATMSSRWMRPNAWPGRATGRAVPARSRVERRAAGAVDSGQPEQVERAPDRPPRARPARPRAAAPRADRRDAARSPRPPSRRRDRHRRRWSTGSRSSAAPAPPRSPRRIGRARDRPARPAAPCSAGASRRQSPPRPSRRGPSRCRQPPLRARCR